MSRSDAGVTARTGAGTVTSLLADSFALHAAELAISDVSGSWTYSELYDRTLRVVGTLQDAGVVPGDRVAVSAVKSRDTVASIIGILLAGATYVPIDPDYPHERRLAMATIASVMLVIGDSVGDFTAISPTDATLGRRADAPVHPSPDDLMYVLFTSGSTGVPKGVMVSHSNFFAYATSWIIPTLGPRARTATTVNLNFDPSLIELLGPLLVGGSVYATASVFSMVDEGAQPDLLCLTPSVALELSRGGMIPDSVTKVTLGGEALLPEVARAVFEGSSVEVIYNCYGPTETTVQVTSSVITRSPSGEYDVTIGPEDTPGTVRVLDAGGLEVGAGVLGELVVFGPQVSQGYIGGHQGGFTEIMGERAYRTGDLAVRRPTGDFEFRGRRDRQIKVRGLRIEQAEVEGHLMRSPGVHEAVVKVYGSGADAELVAYVFGDRADATAIREHVALFAPAYMVPSRVVVLDAIPRNSSNKVDLAALPSPAAATPSGQVGAAEVAVIVAEALHLDSTPSQDADLVSDLHATSLSLIRIIAGIDRRLGVRLPVSSVFGRMTVADLEALVAGHRTQDVITLNDGAPGRPLTLVAAYVGDILRYRTLAEAMPETPVTVVLSREPEGAAPRSIEEMAEGALRALSPQSGVEYNLGGHSAGGLVAFEAARIMLSRGLNVASVTLIDTPRTDSTIGYHWGDVVMNLPEFLRMPVRDKVARLRTIAAKRRAHRSAGDSIEARILHGDASSNAAVSRYRALPAPGLPRLTILKTTQGVVMARSRRLSWSPEYAQSVEFARIPGEHTTMFEDGAVRSTAAATSHALR